ncbi:MAG TPA: hypothetical protein VGZ93_12905 [Candidatus Methylacidiphilales bacterium]|nr:hypothetical protein [Candidatus Methylacidiphilales bacterium]
MIQANCRAQFTADDFSFVVRVLAKSQRDAVSLVSLLSDEAERDAILDHDLIYDSVVDDAGCLQVSAAFYFYILTRRVLRRISLDERALTDYVAAVLLAFSHVSQLRAPGVPGAPGEPVPASRSFAYLSDLIAQAGNCPPEQAFVLRVHTANYALFLSGMFAGRVHAHVQRRGAPGLDFYEAVGQSAYLSVADHPQARRTELQAVFKLLGGEFHRVRLALNNLADTLLHLHETPHILIRPT